MINQDTNRLKRLKENKGFTMIEMAIVLIIIGIIIGAVVKGKDIIRSGEQKKIYTKFINAWQTAYLSFYDRTGKVLGDTYHTANTAVGQDGRADTSGGDGTYTAGTDEAELCTSTNAAWYGLTQAGITCPTTNIDNNSYSYNYIDSAGNRQTMTISFLFDAASNYNYMSITGITTGFAIAMDALIDGSADGTSGDFLNGTGAVWGLTPTTIVPARWKMQI